MTGSPLTKGHWYKEERSKLTTYNLYSILFCSPRMPITPPLLCITLHQRSHLNKMTIGNGFVTISENKGSWVCPICSWHWAQTGTLLALHLTAPSSALHIYTMHHHTTMTEASEWLEIFFLRFTAITAISLCKTNSIQSIINCGNCWSGPGWKILHRR